MYPAKSLIKILMGAGPDVAGYYPRDNQGQTVVRYFFPSHFGSEILNKHICMNSP